MRNSHVFYFYKIVSLGCLLFILFFYSCQKEELNEVKNQINDSVLEGRSTTEVVTFQTIFTTPDGMTTDSFLLKLIPYPSFKSRAYDLKDQQNWYQLLQENTGILLASKGDSLYFSGYYENGAYIRPVGVTEEDQARVFDLCPDPHVIYFTEEIITSWYQIDGFGNIHYLDETSTSTQVIIEICTPPGFDEYYTDVEITSHVLNNNRAYFWLFERIYDLLMAEDAEITNPCEPENTSADNLREVLDGMEVYSLENFYEALTNYYADPCRNQRIIDSLDGYPCAQELLQDLTNSCNSEVTTLIREVFGNSENADILFQAGPLSGSAGITQPEGDALSYIATVTLNEAGLNCTEDYILATMIHEAIHGYIVYYRNQVNYGLMTQSQFDLMFPLFSTTNYDPQHHEMAGNYVNLFVDLLMENNPNLTQLEAEHLAWEGLQGTAAWNQLSQTYQNNVGLTNMAARCQPDPNDLTNYHFTDCN